MKTHTEPVIDEAGRYVAPPQPIYQGRPAGPWDLNTDRGSADVVTEREARRILREHLWQSERPRAVEKVSA